MEEMHGYRIQAKRVCCAPSYSPSLSPILIYEQALVLDTNDVEQELQYGTKVSCFDVFSTYYHSSSSRYLELKAIPSWRRCMASSSYNLRRSGLAKPIMVSMVKQVFATWTQTAVILASTTAS